jgi:hypothetical protein
MTKIFEIKNTAVTNEEDILKELMNCIVEVQVDNRPIPVLGRLIKASPKYITLERRNGSPTIINREAIQLIQPTMNQDRKAVTQ